MKYTSKQKRLIVEYVKRLIEARDNNYAAYEVKKDKVIATVSAQKGSAFTKLAQSWKEFEAKATELEDKKRQLNIEVQAAKDMEETLKDQIREKVVNIFDDSEQAMSLAVHCLNSSFTVSKLSAENQPSTVAKKGDIQSTDYQKVVELLLEQNEQLKTQIDLLIKQCSIIAVEDIVKPGKKRRAGISTTEGMLNENFLWDKIVNAYNKIANIIKRRFQTLEATRKAIDKRMLLIQHSAMKSNINYDTGL